MVRDQWNTEWRKHSRLLERDGEELGTAVVRRHWGGLGRCRCESECRDRPEDQEARSEVVKRGTRQRAACPKVFEQKGDFSTSDEQSPMRDQRSARPVPRAESEEDSMHGTTRRTASHSEDDGKTGDGKKGRWGDRKEESRLGGVDVDAGPGTDGLGLWLGGGAEARMAVEIGLDGRRRRRRRWRWVRLAWTESDLRRDRWGVSRWR